MRPAPGLLALVAHLALLSSVSFGGFPAVLPDVRTYVVADHAWMTDQDFANIFAIAQMLPGPNMILMMGLVGWAVFGFPGALASATATFAPPAMLYFFAFRLWDRFRDAPWQRIARAALAPVTVGLIMASGIVIARAAATSWAAVALTASAAVIVLAPRLNPLLLLVAGGMVGGFSVCCADTTTGGFAKLS
jgi:chromate transporter